MCVIAGAEKVQVIWVQEVCVVDPVKKHNTVYATVGFNNTEEKSGPLFFLLPNAQAKPNDLTDAIFNKDDWITELWQHFVQEVGIRFININEDGNKCVQLLFLTDSIKPQHPIYSFNACKEKFILFPDEKTLKELEKHGSPSPFYLYHTNNIPSGQFIVRFSYVVPSTHEGFSEQMFRIKGPVPVKRILEEKVNKMKDANLKNDYITYLNTVYKRLQEPQYDVICVGNPMDGWQYDVEGPDEHRPETKNIRGKSATTFLYKWVNPKPHEEIPVFARVFTPRGNNFSIELIAKRSRCDYHDKLADKYGEDFGPKLLKDC